MMNLLSTKVTTNATQKHSLLSIIEQGAVQNKLGSIQTKEENLQTLNNINEEFKRKELEDRQVREDMRSIGKILQKNISNDKVKQYENQEKERHNQRQVKDKELKDHINQVKGEKKQKQQEQNNLEQEQQRQSIIQKQLNDEINQTVQANQQQLQKMDDDFQKQLSDKEKLLQSLLQQLEDLKNKARQEKKAEDEIERQIDDCENERERMMAELDRLDEEIDEADMNSDGEDQDILLEKLQEDLRDVTQSNQILDEQLKLKDKLLDQQSKDLTQLNKDKAQIEQEIEENRLDAEHLDELQKKLEGLIDTEKDTFQDNLKVVTQLKQVEVQSQDHHKANMDLESQINLLTDQNYLERKSRNLEKAIRQFEDGLRIKRSTQQQILRKIQRLQELIDNDEPTQEITQRIKHIDEEIINFEKEKDKLRQKKQKAEKDILHKDISEINDDLIRNCMNKYKEIEGELDQLVMNENDAINIDKVSKQFKDVEHQIGVDYYKRGIELQQKQSVQLKYTFPDVIGNILKNVERLERDVIPNIQKIADDEDEKEILQGKIEIAKDITKNAINLRDIIITEELAKLNKHQLKQDDTPYEIIEQYNELGEVQEEVIIIDRQCSNLQKRLEEYEKGLKQFEVELKEDFYQDSCEEVKEQTQLVTNYTKQVEDLKAVIELIEGNLDQIRTSKTLTSDVKDMEELLSNLKDQQQKLEYGSANNAKKVRQLENELSSMNLTQITPQHLEDVNQEIEKQREQIQGQLEQIKTTLNDVKLKEEETKVLVFQKIADKRQECKRELKKITDNYDEIDRILQEIDINLEMIWKDALYMKQSEWSPVKGRTSILYGVGGDQEKEMEMKEQYAILERAQQYSSDLIADKKKQKKKLIAFQQQYEEAKDANILQLEQMYDAFETYNVDQQQILKSKCVTFLDDDLKKLKEVVEEMIERYKQKRAILADCRKEQKNKSGQLSKLENNINGYKMRVNQMEKELFVQSNVDLKGNTEKNQILQQLIKDVQSLKHSIQMKGDEIEKEKHILHHVTKDLDLMPEKVVTLNDLKVIYKNIMEMRKLDQFKKELNDLFNELQAKEQQVEQFIKDLLGGTMYECERKVKECEALMDKLNKKLMDLNNGINDFELDLKKGAQNNKNLEQDCKALLDEQGKDRDEMSAIEKEKNQIKAVLAKIKGELENKGRPMSSQHVEELINEVEVCMKKGDGQLRPNLEVLEENLQKRKDQYQALLFKGAEQDTLIDEITKTQATNQSKLASLQDKQAKMDQLLKGIKDACSHMVNNPDYEGRAGQVAKMNETNEASIAQNKAILEELKKIEQQGKSLAKDNLRSLPLKELQALSMTINDQQGVLNEVEKQVNQVDKDTQKRRQKLHDGDILDNFKKRVDEFNELDNINKEVEKGQAELEKIIAELMKMNKDNAKEIEKQLNSVKQEVTKLRQKQDIFSKQLNQFKDKIKEKDLNKENPIVFGPLIDELKELRQQIQVKNEENNKILSNIQFLQNKYGNVDIDKKLSQYQLDQDDQLQRLALLHDDIVQLKVLQDNFDGYTSDVEEEDFIERLGNELPKVDQKQAQCTEEASELKSSIEILQKALQRKNVDIEEKAKQVWEIEERNKKNKKNVEGIEQKVMKTKKVFNSMQIKEKLKRRHQELHELSKRIDTFAHQVNELLSDLQTEQSKIKYGQEGYEKRMEQNEKMKNEMLQCKDHFQKLSQSLVKIEADINDGKEQVAKFGSQIKEKDLYSMLIKNIQIKKSILQSLDDIKDARNSYNKVKKDHEKIKEADKKNYKAAKGDQVDALLADWLNNNNCPVPIKRLGQGYYMFGTKKIFAKVINGKLVIRVGGGYMGIEEFMFYYGAQELNKMIAFEAVDEDINLGVAVDHTQNTVDLMKQADGNKAAIIGIAQMKKRLSPRQFSPRAASPNANAQNAVKKSQQSNYSPRNNPNNQSTISDTKSDQEKRRVPTGRKSPTAGQQQPSSSFLKKTALKMQKDQK